MIDPNEIFRELIAFRKGLGIEEDKNDFVVEMNPIEQVKLQLESSEGIIVEFDEIEELAGGSLLTYKENLAILYISDTNRSKSYLEDDAFVRKSPKGGNETKAPKFHFAWCTTLEHMRNKNRYDRYVLVRNADGLFRVYAKEDKYSEPYELDKRVNLYVCQNCLSGRLGKETDKIVGYKGFHKNWSQDEKYKAVEDFNIKQFLDENEGVVTTIKHATKHTDQTDRVNIYTHDFREVSRELREESGWTCSSCNVDMSRKKQGLHTHHINGVKYDNKKKNLMVLCALCHKNIDEFHKTMHVPRDVEKYILRARKEN